MNVIIMLIIITATLAAVGAFLGCIGKPTWVFMLYILGLVFLAIGIYLFPASMWKNISVAFLLIGMLMDLIAIIVTFKQKIKNKAKQK